MADEQEIKKWTLLTCLASGQASGARVTNSISGSSRPRSEWPDWAIYHRLGNFLKPSRDFHVFLGDFYVIGKIFKINIATF